MNKKDFTLMELLTNNIRNYCFNSGANYKKIIFTVKESAFETSVENIVREID